MVAANKVSEAAQTGIFWRIDTETPLATGHLACFASYVHRDDAYGGRTREQHRTYTRQEEKQCWPVPTRDDPWKAFSTADILAIGHDIVYRYTRRGEITRGRAEEGGRGGEGGGHTYNLPTFLRLVSRVILTLC